MKTLTGMRLLSTGLLLLAFCKNGQAQDAQVSKADTDSIKDKGLAAAQEAAKAGKYFFVFFFRSEDEKTVQARKIFDETMAKVADRAATLAINVASEPEAGLVKQHQVANAPMPLVLAIAPNGAVTAGLRTSLDEKSLVAAFVSPGFEKSLKGLQDGKLVVISVQNNSTKSNKAAMKGTDELKADPKLGGTTEVITVDPADEKEAKHMKMLGVDPKSDEAQTVLLAPPGTILGLIKGATTKAGLLSTIQAASTGCGTGGCGPKGCK